jgi:hypothetical protein
MPAVTITYDYVYFGGGSSHTRQPRSSTGPGGFTLIYSLPGGTADAGNTFGPGAQPASLVNGGITYEFAFMNVSGGTPAGQTTSSGVTSFTPSTPPPPVTVGTAPIVVLVVYIPVGGVGNGTGSGAIIDSFDNTTGQLFSDTFVSVSPDPGGPPPPLTKSGNVDGYVDTSKATETITALSPTSPTGVVFAQWMNFYPQGSPKVKIAGAALAVDQGTTSCALAFYNVKVDPCAYLRQELASINPGDFPNYPAYEAARERLLQELVACERAHGEIPPVK